jgi:adenosylcobinamide-GDP ribazoletransferase
MTAPLTGELEGTSSPAGAGEHPARSAPATVRGMRAAFALFTRLPVGGFPYDDRALAWAPAHGPLVGWVVGAALGVLDLCLLPLGGWAAAALVLGAAMLVTGALHEDGLADTSDALGGGHDRARVFAILKDSRVGTFGAAALTCSIVARAALLAQLGPAVLFALPAAWCAARVGPVWLMALLPYVTPNEAKSHRFVGAGWPQVATATAWFFACMAALTAQGSIEPRRMALVVAVVAATTALTGWRYYRRMGGITGDFLGATEQLCEIGALAVLAWPG